MVYEIGSWLVVPLRPTRRAAPGRFAEYAPACDIPNGQYFVDDRIQYDPRMNPFIVMKLLSRS